MNSFKPSAMTIALAGAFGAGLFAAPAAHALDTTRSSAAVSAGNVIYYSGATAPTKAIWRAFRQLCKISSTDTFDVYKAGTTTTSFDPGDSGYGNSFTYTCKLKSAGDPAPVPTSFQGLDVAFMVGVTDGSFSSIRGFTTEPTQQQLYVTTTFSGCGATTSATSDGDSTFANCNTERVRAMGGFSDVEAAVFQDLLPTPGGVNQADVIVTPVNAGQVFGLAVSEVLYRALQVAQGLPADCQNDGPFTATVVAGADDRSPACQPSISTTQYSSIVNNLKSATPKSQGWGFMGVPGNPAITLCRRVAVSGTQATSNLFFLSNPCARGPQTGGERSPAGLSTSGNANLGTRLFISTNSGSSDARRCLNNTVPTPTTAVGGVTAGTFRIGVLSAENKPEATDTFAFIKLNGAAVNEDAQNRVSTIDGRYEYAYELALHTHVSDTVTPLPVRALYEQIRQDLGNPTISDLAGVFQVRSAAFPHTSNPTRISKGTRAGNSCQPFTF